MKEKKGHCVLVNHRNLSKLTPQKQQQCQPVKKYSRSMDHTNL